MNIEETTAKAAAGLDRSQDSLENLGHTASEALDAARRGTAVAFENAASTVRATADGGAETIGTVAQSAAAKLESTAAYVRTHDAGDMLLRLRQLITRHPAGFLIVAAGIVLLAGSHFRRAKPHD